MRRMVAGLLCLATACSFTAGGDVRGNSSYVSLLAKPGEAWVWRVYPPRRRKVPSSNRSPSSATLMGSS